MSIKIDRRFGSLLALFFIEALAFSSWLPRLPELRERMGLGEGELGLVLMAMPAGALLIMPIVGLLSMRVDIRTLNLVCMSWLLLATVLLPITRSAPWLATSLFSVGLGTGSMGVAMNAAGLAVECALAKPVLSRCHAMFSIGVTVGGGIGGAAAAFSVPLSVQTPVLGLVLAGLLLIIMSGIPHQKADSGKAGPSFALHCSHAYLLARLRATRALLAPALIAFFCLLAEGATLDWSAIFLRDVLQTEALVGGGVVAFAGAMAFARIIGDWLVTRFAAVAMAAVGAALAAGGFLTVTLAGGISFALAGFALAGLGVAGIVPIVFRAAGRTSGVAPGVGVAVVSSVGYAGFLVGPALMGLMGEAGGLRLAFGMVAVMLCLVLALAPTLRRKAAAGALKQWRAQPGSTHDQAISNLSM